MNIVVCQLGRLVILDHVPTTHHAAQPHWIDLLVLVGIDTQDQLVQQVRKTHPLHRSYLTCHTPPNIQCTYTPTTYTQSDTCYLLVFAIKNVRFFFGNLVKDYSFQNYYLIVDYAKIMQNLSIWTCFKYS